MNEDQIRQIVQDELSKSNIGGSFNTVPYHIHNNSDSPQLVPQSTKGFTPLPSLPNLGATPSVDNGVFSPQNLFGLSVSSPQAPGTFVPLAATTYVYPVPVIFGGMGTLFNGGVAPIGSIVAAFTSSGYELWVRYDDSWHGVALPLTT